jgi:Ca2+:H+ antiporter
MEIGSAYALQVCLLQIPAMVAFSAWYNPASMGEVAKTFSYVTLSVIAVCLTSDYP